MQMVFLVQIDWNMQQGTTGGHLEWTGACPCPRKTYQGDGTVEVQLDAISLLPGTYDFHTSITDFNRSHIYDNLHVAFRFDVMSGKPYESSGVVTVRPQWTIG